jgi:hypothetical protein
MIRNTVKRLLLIILLAIASAVTVNAQKVDSIYFNLYTDSLKKGPLYYNYINVDGKLSNGNYLPLDTTQIRFTCSAGKMTGNVLQLDSNEAAPFVIVTATLKQNPAVTREVKIYVKTVIIEEKLKTTEELLNEWNKKAKKKN